MSLIIIVPETVFNPEDIKKGDLIRAKHYSWAEWKSGAVTTVQPDKVTVLFLPGTGNVTSYFQIPVSEVEDGDWGIRWTTDLVEIKTEGVDE